MLPIFTRLHAILASTVLEGDNPAYYMDGSVLRFQYLVFSDSRTVYYLYGLLKPCWEYVLPSHPSGGGLVAEMMAHIRVTNHCCHWETRTVQGLSTADQTKTYFETSGKKFSTGAEIRATRDTVDDTHKEQIGPNIAFREQLLWCSNPLHPRFPSCFYTLISVFACH